MRSKRKTITSTTYSSLFLIAFLTSLLAFAAWIAPKSFTAGLPDMTAKGSLPMAPNPGVLPAVKTLQSPAYAVTSLIDPCSDVLAGTCSPGNNLGNRTPVILIHGIHGDHAQDTFKNLVVFLSRSTAYNTGFKTYRFHYVSDMYSLWDISEALRQRIDEMDGTGGKPDFRNKPIIIIAHSMGGLVARQYMLLTTQSGNDPRYTNRPAGERIIKLITLATPHHGTYGANGLVRNSRFFSILDPVRAVEATGAFYLGDTFFWGLTGCPACILDLQHPNRGTLLWNNLDKRWSASLLSTYSYVESSEANIQIPDTARYNQKIMAYWGEYNLLDTAWQSLKAIKGAKNWKQLASKFQALQADGIASQYQSALSAYLIQSSNVGSFKDISNIAPQNDGLVPVESARFDPLGGATWRLMGRVHCPGYNHTQFNVGSSGRCQETGKNLFDSVLADVLGVGFTLPAMLFGPEKARLGYGAYGNALASKGLRTLASTIENNTTVELNNAGDSALQVTSLSLTGTNPDQFSIVSAPLTPFTIPAKSAVNVIVGFNPSSTGLKTATLQASNTSSNSSVAVALEGFGAPASCDIVLSPENRYLPVTGGSGSFTVPSISCPWSLSVNQTWIHANASGDIVSFSVDSNTSGATRGGEIDISIYGRIYSFDIQQGGSSSGCTLNLSPDTQNFTSSGGAGSFNVITPDSCGWGFQSGSPWITAINQSIHIGSGSINFTVAPNTSSLLRFGTIIVEGQDIIRTFTVSQDAGSNSCTYSLSSSEQAMPAAGGANSFSIITGSGCPWRISTPERWLNFNSPNNGTGSRTISYTATANGYSSIRLGDISIQGATSTPLLLTVRQDGVPVLYPTISLPTTSFQMGDALLNTTIYQGITINNSGPAYLLLSSAYRSTGSTDFDLLPYEQNQSIAPGGSTSITIKLTPSSTGSRSATFSISSNDPNQPIVNFSISGNGVTQIAGGIDFVWSNKATIPESQFIYAASAVLNNNIYVFGGSFFQRGYKYDPTTNIWTRIADAPYGTDEGGASVINGKIYLVGHPSVNNVQIYDPSTNSWTVGAPIPTPRRGAVVVSANAKLYVIGGADGSLAPNAIVEVYDPQVNTWTQKADMPTPRGYASGVSLNNLIYVTGGQGSGGTRTGATEVFDPIANSWSTRQSDPTRRASASAVTLNNKIYVIGGSLGGPDTIDLVEEHDPSLPGPFNTWFSRNHVLTARANFVAGVVNGKVYVIGGRANNGGVVTTVEEGVLAASPKVSLPVTSITCSDVPIGTICEKQIEIQNLGNALLTLSYAQLSGSQEFSLFRVPNTLAAGASGQIKVRLTPTSTGSKSASFRINTNDPATPSLTFNVTGNGVAFQPLTTGSWQVTQSMQLPVGSAPRSIAIKDGKAYVSKSNASLSVIDLASSSVSANISFTPYPNSDTGGVVIAGNKAYVSLSNLGENGQLAVINRDTNSVSTYVPVGIEPRAVVAYNNRVYVAVRAASSNPPSIKVLDTNTSTIIGTIPLGGDGSYYATAIAIEPSLGRAYVTTSCIGCGESGGVSVIDLATNTVINTVAITSYEPVGISIIGNRAYVCTNASVEVIDLSSSAVISTITLPDSTYRITSTSEYVLVLNYGLDKLIAISAATNTVVGEVSIFYPLEIGTDSATNYVYVGTGSDALFKTLHFVAPGFSISTNTSSLAATAGGNTAFTTTVTSIDGFSGAVSLGCEGLPTGGTCQFSQNPVTLQANGTVSTSLTVNVPAGTVPGPYSLRVVGSGSVTLSRPGVTKSALASPADTVSLTDFQNLSLTVPSCDFAISTQSISVGAGSSAGSVNVLCTAGCAWMAVSNDTWITVTSGSTGTGNGVVNYSISANSGPARMGTITIAGNTCTVSQASGCGTITILPSTLTAGMAGTPYPVTTFMASGGLSPYNFTIPVGSLPTGMMLSSGGVLDGTPTAFGTFPFTVRATDNTGGCFGEQAYSLVINPLCGTIIVNPPSMPNGFVGTTYTQPLSAAGGTSPYTFTLDSGSFPPGVNISGTNLTGTPTTTGTFNFVIKATDNVGCVGTQAYSVVISGTGLQFYPLAHPVRLLDTRVGATGCDVPGAMIVGGTSRTQTAAGRTCDGLTIPANARAVTGNITTVQSGGGFLTLYPSDVSRPLVANSNYSANQVLNNVFTVGLGATDGAFNIFVTTDTNVVVDITGYYAPPSGSGLYFHPLPHPVRLLDTRAGQMACFTPGAQLAADSTTTQLGTTTCDGVLIPAGALALVGNATTVGPQANGFLTLFPANATRPLAASSNFQTGINMNAPFTVGLSPSGEFSIYTAATTNLVVDVLGYYSAQLNDTNGQGLLFNPLPTPVRLLDTRTGATGCFTPGGQMIGGTAYQQPATGVCTGIPVAAKAVVGNATTVNVSANGFLTFWPSDASQPNVATSNYRSGTVFNRHFTVGLGPDGAFKRFASSTTDLVIDLSGYFAP